ncbi:MAG: LptE family protein [Bacteroidales bacterium]|nr:LptE family protein [Bacteroidales bacterium]
MNRKTNLIIVFIGLIILSGCKVKYSFSGASISPEIKTVSVQYFVNRAPLSHPTLSQNLTDALKDKFQAQTNLIIVNGEGDVDFEGEITNYDIRPTSITAEERAAQNRLTITIKVKFTNSVEPDLSFNKSFSRYEDVGSDKSLSDVDEETINGIINELIQDIFNEAFVNW